MGSTEADQRRVLIGAAGLLVLVVAGLVLASSWFVAYPAVVMLSAWLLAVAGMATVSVIAFRQAMAANTSFSSAIGQSFNALRQFVLAFF